MKLTFKSTDINNSKYLPTGKHLVRITTVNVGTSSAGNQSLNVSVVGLGEYEGKTAVEYLSLMESARWKISALAQACGIAPEYLKSGDFDTSDLVGKTFLLERKEVGTRTDKKDGSEKKVYKSFYYPSPEEMKEADMDLSDEFMQSEIGL